VRPAIRPVPGVRPNIGFRPPSRDIRPPAQTNIYNRLPAKSRDVPRAPSAFERSRPITGRPNNVYADQRGEVYRRTTNGQWQQRESGRWKPSPGGTSGRPGGPAGVTERPGKRPVVTTRPAPGFTRPAPRPELDRDFSARQRGDDRMRERSSQQRERSREVRPAPQPQARPAQQARPAPPSHSASPGGRGGGADKNRHR
jgi:hypothetical protein